MALGKHYKIEGGKKKGHSNMNHWEGTEIIKERTKRLRRINDKKIITEEKSKWYV